MKESLHWKQIVALSGGCVKELDANGKIVAVNEKCCEALEAAGESELLGKSWRDLWPKSLWPDIESAMELARQGQIGRFSGEAATLHGRKRYWDVMVSRSPVGSNPENLLMMRHDVTVHQQANSALQTLNAALRKQLNTQRSDVEDATDRYARHMEQFRDQQYQFDTAQQFVDALRQQLESTEK